MSVNSYTTMCTEFENLVRSEVKMWAKYVEVVTLPSPHSPVVSMVTSV